MRAAFAVLLLASPAAALPALSTPYACEDGRTVDAATVILPYTSVAVVSVDGGAPVALNQAVSADGTRYTGADLQWWEIGVSEAMLAPLAAGEDIASDPGVRCKAHPRGVGWVLYPPGTIKP